MTMKEWLHSLPPPRSLVALVLATAGFCVRLTLAHFTQSPTLQVDVYYSLCRLLGLITTMFSSKYKRANSKTGKESRLRNTFGWARIEVVGRLCVHVLFASFALALIIAALQTIVHSLHERPPRWPRLTVGAGVAGLMLHAIGYLLLAGREMSYSRRLSFTEDGGVVIKYGGSEPVLVHAPTDITCSLFVIAAGLSTEWSKSGVGELWSMSDQESNPGPGVLIDPILSAVACCLLVTFNYPHMRAAGLVLLQTVPEGLGTAVLRKAILKVEGVLAVHELHVWQLNRDRIVATAHIFYAGAEEYLKSSSHVMEVFKKHGITLVTLQPEFPNMPAGNLLPNVCDLSEACSQPCAAACTAPRCCCPPSSSSSSSVPSSTSTPPSTPVIEVPVETLPDVAEVKLDLHANVKEKFTEELKDNELTSL